MNIFRLSKKTVLFLTLAILAWIVSISGSVSNAELSKNIVGEFYYSGATPFAALTRDGVFEEITKIFPHLQLSFAPQSIGTDRAIADLISGKLAFAHSDRPPSKAESIAAKEVGFEIEAIPINVDGIAIFVNPKTGIKSLTVGQLRAIYRGEVRNWQELGGANQSIVPYKIDPSIDSFSLGGDSASGVKALKSYTSAVSHVGLNAGGIGYASAASVKEQKVVRFVAIAKNKNNLAIPSVNADRSANTLAFTKDIYPLTRKLYVLIPRDSSPREKVAVAYTDFLLGDSGRKIIADSGFSLIFSN